MVKYEVKKRFVDVKGWQIGEGTRIITETESVIDNPLTNKKEFVAKILIDNGTGMKKLFPETAIIISAKDKANFLKKVV